MYCTNCGSKLNEGAMFCPNCGAKIRKTTQEVNMPQPALNMEDYIAQPAYEPAASAKKHHFGKIVAAVCAVAVLVSGILIYNHVADAKEAAEELERERTTVTDSIEYAGISFPLTDCFTIDEENSTDDVPIINVSSNDESANMFLETTAYTGSNSFEDQALVDELFPASQGNILSYSEFGDYAGLTWRKARLMIFERSSQGTLSMEGILTVYIGKEDNSDVLHVVEFRSDSSNLTELTDAMIQGAEAVETTEEVPVQEVPAETAAVAAPSADEFCNSDTWTEENELVFSYLNTQTFYSVSFVRYNEDDGTYYIVLSVAPDYTDENMVAHALLGLVEADLSTYGVKCAVIFTDLDYDVYATYNSTDGLQETDWVEWYSLCSHDHWWSMS